jgi:hypothetical protein
MTPSIPENKFVIEINVDPARLTEEQIKQINDKIVADVAYAASRPRGGDICYSQFNKGCVFWK